MGCFSTKADNADNTGEGGVDEEDGNPLRVLCLGVGGCGKTTFIKQMRNIYNVPWLDIELENYAKIVRSNLITGVQECLQIVAQSKELSMKEENKEAEEKVMELSRTADLTQGDTKQLLIQVFNDPAVQEVVNTMADKLQFSSFGSYFDDIDAICEDNFRPNDDQILRCRQRTVGSHSTSIRMNEGTFEFHDVGGQKPERTKWAKAMEENQFIVILFFLAADQFDTMSDGTLPSEYDNKTKLICSKDIFSEILDYNETRNIPIVVFLNRKDLFQTRIESKNGWKSYKTTFPEYKGKQDIQETLDHMKSVFLKEANEKYGIQPITHFTCSLDTKAMEFVWNSIKTELLTNMVQKD